MGKNETDKRWSITLGDSPVVGTAIHAGSQVRAECMPLYRLSESERFREEDPFTDDLIADFPNRIVVHQSRFEVDINRARDIAVYLTPEQAWGMTVWHQPPAESVVTNSLAFHDAYYAELKNVLADIERRYSRFVVIDVHSYNHRRDGAQASAMPQDKAPDINVGTFSMDRQRWAPLVDAFIGTLKNHQYNGRSIDVRENISFQGKGEQTRFVHEQFPETGCAIAVEFKKTFMDEWTGEPDRKAIEQLRQMLSSTIPVLERALHEAT